MIAQGKQMIVLQPQGRLDFQCGTLLKQQIATLVRHPKDLWIIDLASVDFVDGSGLVALIAGLSAARQSGCRLVLCNVQASVQSVLELTRLDEVFDIIESYNAV